MNSSISITLVLRRTFGTYTSRAAVVLPLAAFVVVPINVLDTLPSRASPAFALVVLVVDIAMITLFTGLIVQLAADAHDDTHVQSLGQLLRAIRPVFGQLVLVGTVAGSAIAFLFAAASLLLIGLVIGAILGTGSVIGTVIVGVVLGTILSLGPGLFLLTIWSVAAPVVVLERPGGLLALPRSQSLVRGNRRRVFAAIVLLAVTIGLAGSAIELAGDAFGSGPALAVRLLVATLIAPIPPLAASALYFELRGGSTGAPQPGPPVGVPSQPHPAAPAQDGAPTPPWA